MIIYPDIEIHGGQCVNLKHGGIDAPQKFSKSPQQAAKEFEDAGAEWLHIIDIDGVFDGATEKTGGDNGDVIREIISKANIPVQVGGGVRSASVIKHWFDSGAERVVLGTAAVTDQRLIEESCVAYPQRILISIDARNGMAVSHGWQHTSALGALELAQRYERCGAAGIIYTDIDKYDELPESSMANTTQMASDLSCPVISSGTVRNLDDVSMLTQLPNIAGAVIGWALFSGAITLEDALAHAQQKTTKAAMI